MEPHFDARLTWPEADALRTLLGEDLAVHVLGDGGIDDSVMEVCLTGAARPLQIVPFEVPTPVRDHPWLDVERPRVQRVDAVQPAQRRFDIGRVREIAVFTTAVWWSAPEPVTETLGGLRLGRAMRSVQRRFRSADQKIIDELVAEADAAAAQPRLTLVDEAIELVGRRVLRVWTLGFRLFWMLDGEFEGDDYERHVLAGGR